MAKYTEKKISKKTNEKVFITGPLDLKMFFAVLFLNIYGIIMIYSATYSRYGTRFLKSQLVFVGAGLAAMLFLSYFNYQIIVHKMGIAALVLSLGVLFLLKTNLSSASSNGATRAIQISKSISVQPAEAIKLGMIVFFSYYVKKIGVDQVGKRLYLLIISLAFLILVKEFANNLSTGIIIFGIAFTIMLMSSPNPGRWLAVAGALAAAVFLFCLLYTVLVPYEPGMEESFRYTRIRAWLDPISFASSVGMQVSLARYALGAGGFWGKGLGKSLIKYTLPEARNDFILAVIFEELGVFGVLLLMFLFGYLLYRIFLVIMEAPDISGKVIAIGVFTHFTLQVAMNVLVVVGLFPTTGVSLPFISAGGSSAVFLLLELGIVFNIDKSARELKYRQEAEAYVRMKEEAAKTHGRRLAPET